MRIVRSKDWWLAKARNEGSSAVSAGLHAVFGVAVGERETSMRPTPSDAAILQSRTIHGGAYPIKSMRVTDDGPVYAVGLPEIARLPVMYIRSDEAHYVDQDEDVLKVEGPCEIEPDTDVCNRSTLPLESYDWGDAG